jgi:Trp operon repressor
MSEEGDDDEDESGNKENLNISKMSRGSNKIKVPNKSKKILHSG